MGLITFQHPLKYRINYYVWITINCKSEKNDATIIFSNYFTDISKIRSSNKEKIRQERDHIADIEHLNSVSSKLSF